MSGRCVITAICCASVWIGGAALQIAQAQNSRPFILSEQRCLSVRDPASLPSARLPDIAPPNTVREPDKDLAPHPISLDQAIRIALENAEVIRVLTGVGASTSGRTVYDVAIVNTDVDRQNARFDPTLDVTTTGGKVDRPGAIFDTLNPGASLITGASTDSIETSIGLSKTMYSGADIGLAATASRSYFEPGVFPLEPEDASGLELSLRQPLMQGYGWQANLAPIVVARIDAERSFFQFKDSTQELVRGVIAAYWSLVAARVDVWAREQQVQQSEFGYARATARMEEGLSRAADVAQARSALANFRASLIAARSNRILAESALRNILRLEPDGKTELVPTSAPTLEQIDFDWYLLIASAEKYRPDIIELKLVTEADQQLLLQADNQARPQLDGIASYRWDGLQGEMPNGADLRSGPGQFAGFNVGINFSVPLGLRQSRAGLRRQELILARDRSNLDQAIHEMVHQLAVNYRNLAQNFEQIRAYKEAREAALTNYENQVAEFRAGRQNFLNVLQAITDWGNAVSQEALSVTQYNTELANIERQTGTILESHGIVFHEERYGSIGPRGRLFADECYPERLQPSNPIDRYPDSGNPAESSFDLQDIEAIRDRFDEPPAPKSEPQEQNERENPDPPTAPQSRADRYLFGNRK